MSGPSRANNGVVIVFAQRAIYLFKPVEKPADEIVADERNKQKNTADTHALIKRRGETKERQNPVVSCCSYPKTRYNIDNGLGQ